MSTSQRNAMPTGENHCDGCEQARFTRSPPGKHKAGAQPSQPNEDRYDLQHLSLRMTRRWFCILGVLLFRPLCCIFQVGEDFFQCWIISRHVSFPPIVLTGKGQPDEHACIRLSHWEVVCGYRTRSPSLGGLVASVWVL
jgi:hypothetical protein